MGKKWHKVTRFLRIARIYFPKEKFLKWEIGCDFYDYFEKRYRPMSMSFDLEPNEDEIKLFRREVLRGCRHDRRCMKEKEKLNNASRKI